MGMIQLATVMAFVAFAGNAGAAEHRTTFGVGVDYSSGRYGASADTQILSVPISARHHRGRWSLRASLPWLRVSGDPNVLPTLGLVDRLNPLATPVPEARRTASGVGDLTLGASYSVPTGGKLGMDLGVNAKIATADKEKGLGTGANDYGATIDLYREFNRTTVFGGAGHTRLGASELVGVDSANSANAGASQRVGRSRIGAMYQQRTALARQQETRREVVGFLNVATASKGQIQVYASHGLTDSSPAWGVGVAFSTGQ